jgi:phytepsin
LGKTGTYDCSTPHILTFEIGGKKFPVDPRDFPFQAFENNINECAPNVVATDPPQTGFLYSWSLGDPFLKSVLTSFYFGNLTRPSVDPPRMGFLSTMPNGAADRLAQGVAAARRNRNNFLSKEEPAPSGTFTPVGTGIGGVGLAPTASVDTSTNGTTVSTTPSTLITLPAVPSPSESGAPQGNSASIRNSSPSLLGLLMVAIGGVFYL